MFCPFKNFEVFGLGPVGVLQIFTGLKKVYPHALTTTLITEVLLNTVQDYGVCAKNQAVFAPCFDPSYAVENSVPL